MKKTVLVLCMVTILIEMMGGGNRVYASSIGNPMAVSVYSQSTAAKIAKNGDDEKCEFDCLDRYIVCVDKTRVQNRPGRFVALPVLPRRVPTIWIYKNEPVYVIQITNGWAKIKVKYGWGYVNAKHIKFKGYPDAWSSKIITKKYKVKVGRTVIRKGAGSSYASAGYLYKNDIVNVRSMKKGWAKFKVRGKWRYVKASDLKRK